MTLLAKSPPFTTEEAYMFPPMPADTADTSPPGLFPEDFSVTVLAVAVRMALFVTWRLTTPARPPAMNPPGLPEPASVWEEELLWLLPKCWREKPRTAPTPLAVTRASAIREPPVCPTFTPRLDMKESIFWDTFKKAMAHRNHTRTLPDTASRPAASTWACASLSEKAKAVWPDRQKRSAIRKRTVNSFLYFFMVIAIPFYVFSQRQWVCYESPDHGCEQAQAPGIHEQEEYLPAEHPAPGFENVRGGLGGPHGKSHGRGVYQNP